jgi:hypothetical protein
MWAPPIAAVSMGDWGLLFVSREADFGTATVVEKKRAVDRLVPLAEVAK